MSPLSLLFLSFFFPISSSLQTPITLSLHTLPLPPHPDPLLRLAAVASASLLRASALKKKAPPYSSATTPLSSHSYGGYSIPLLFGTPPQPLPLLLDTGSSLSWLPCTHSYRCSRCSSPSSTPLFLPKSSSSARIVGCRNPKCSWIHPQSLISSCPAPTTNTTAAVCPPYILMYGSGSTAGLLLSETLSLSPSPNSLQAPNFAVGCSVYADRQPPGGLAGFGRGPISLPSQLGLSRFSYCLISRRFDDDPRESGSLVLDPVVNSFPAGLRFTPLLKNPNSTSDAVSAVYYYVSLRRISVGGAKVKIPYRALVPSPGGDGGAIVDSGTTFTYMSPAVFEPVAAAFVDRVAGRYNRSAEVEERTGLRPCFEIPAGAAVGLPEMTLHFKGGAEMRLPLENYFAFAGTSRAAACLTVVTDAGDGDGDGAGPAVILGSFQQQNYYVVYDLERERIGFRQQACVHES